MDSDLEFSDVKLENEDDDNPETVELMRRISSIEEVSKALRCIVHILSLLSIPHNTS